MLYMVLDHDFRRLKHKEEVLTQPISSRCITSKVKIYSKKLDVQLKVSFKTTLKTTLTEL